MTQRITYFYKLRSNGYFIGKIWFVFISLISTTAFAQRGDDIHKIQVGLEYILTDSTITQKYGLEGLTDRPHCAKITVFMISDSITARASRNFERQELCVNGESKKEIFFRGYEAYFDLVDYSTGKRQNRLKLQYITPYYQPPGENELFALLEYQLVGEDINVIRFEEIIVEKQVKVKSGKKIKTNLMEK